MKMWAYSARGALIMQATGLHQLGSEVLQAVRDSLMRHQWTLAIGLPFVLGSYFLPVPQFPEIGPGYGDLLVVAIESLWIAGGLALFRRRRIPLSRLAGVLVVAAASKWFLTAFTRWKAFMPQWAPFTWDERLLAAGAWMHGGEPPALRLLPILGSPVALSILDRLYDTAFAVMAVVILWQAWSDDRERARRFMLAYILVWVGMGIVVAGMFSSVGPILLDRLTGDPTFVPLLQAMHRAGRDGTLDAAASLWNWWTAVGATCISAFPSIHVAMPALYACVSRGWLRVIFVVYTLTTFVGSFMLGWHYVLDGYAGILGAIACWWIAGRMIRSSDHVTAVSAVA